MAVNVWQLDREYMLYIVLEELTHGCKCMVVRQRYMLYIVLEELSHGCKCMVVRQRIHVVYSSRGTFPWL